MVCGREQFSARASRPRICFDVRRFARSLRSGRTRTEHPTLFRIRDGAAHLVDRLSAASSRWNRCSVRIVRATPKPTPSKARRRNRDGKAPVGSPARDPRAEHAQGLCHDSIRFFPSVLVAGPGLRRHPRRNASGPSRARRHVRGRVPHARRRGPLCRARTLRRGPAGPGGLSWRSPRTRAGASGVRSGALARPDRDLRELSVHAAACAAPCPYEYPRSPGGNRRKLPVRDPSNRVGGP